MLARERPSHSLARSFRRDVVDVSWPVHRLSGQYGGRRGAHTVGSGCGAERGEALPTGGGGQRGRFASGRGGAGRVCGSDSDGGAAPEAAASAEAMA